MIARAVERRTCTRRMHWQRAQPAAQGPGLERVTVQFHGEVDRILNGKEEQRAGRRPNGNRISQSGGARRDMWLLAGGFVRANGVMPDFALLLFVSGTNVRTCAGGEYLQDNDVRPT